MKTRTEPKDDQSKNKDTGVFRGGVRHVRAGSWAWAYLTLFGGDKEDDSG